MKIIKPNKSNIKQAVQVLKRGGVIVYPTDTAYALGGRFNSKKVTKLILDIKKRRDEKFTIIASSLYQVKKFFKLNSLEIKLAKKYWPGPLSIVVSVKFAVRVPKNKIARDICRQVGTPLIATSANITGTKTQYNSKEIIKQFNNKKNPRLDSRLSESPASTQRGENAKRTARQEPELIIDAGKLKKTKTSTIVKVKSGKIKILRKGGIIITNN